jgi:hypothetical protein
MSSPLEKTLLHNAAYSPLVGLLGDLGRASAGFHGFIHPDERLFPTTPEALAEILAARVAEEVSKLDVSGGGAIASGGLERPAAAAAAPHRKQQGEPDLSLYV